MNLSASQVEDCTAGKRDDRPDSVDDLTLKRRVGWKQGSPVVGEQVGLDGNVSDAYEHYSRGDDLFHPQARDFLRDLIQSDLIGSIDDLADELNTDRSDVKQALELHELDEPTETDMNTKNNDSDYLELPNGETWSTDLFLEPIYSDPRVLTSLLAEYGMSAEECATYLTDTMDVNVTAREIRKKGRQFNLID